MNSTTSTSPTAKVTITGITVPGAQEWVIDLPRGAWIKVSSLEIAEDLCRMLNSIPRHTWTVK